MTSTARQLDKGWVPEDLRHWMVVSAACLAAALLSAVQIYLRQRLGGGVSSWDRQLLLNLVAWLPWVPLGVCIIRGANRRPLAGRGPRRLLWRNLALHVGFAHLAAGSYLSYLALFRYSFFPEVAGPLSWLGLLLQIGREAGSFYVTCLGLYTLLVAVVSLRLQRAERVARASGGTWHGSRGAARPETVRAPSKADCLAIRSLGRTRFVRIATIDRIQGEGCYARLHVGLESHLLRRSLTALSEELAGHGFERVHRSTIVNLNRVRKLNPVSHGDATLTLRDGSAVRVSRSYRARLLAALGPAAAAIQFASR